MEEENNATSVDVEEAHVEDTDEEEQNEWETEWSQLERKTLGFRI